MKKATEINNPDRKALGLSLQILLERARSENIIIDNDSNDSIISNYQHALKCEEENNFIDAIYHYRHVIDIYEKNYSHLSEKEYNNTILENNKELNDNQVFEIVLKSMNNLGVICYEISRLNEAMFWFNNILNIDPSNQLAKENLALLRMEN